MMADLMVPGRTGLKARTLLEKLFANWIVKILSISVAVVLFLFQRLSSMEERFFSVPLQYTVDAGFIATDVSVGSVRIILRGSGDEIFLVLEDDIEAFADVSLHRSEGIFKAPVVLRKKGSAETIDMEMSVEPLAATVTIEQKIVKELEVAPALKGYPATGYELVQYLTTPKLIEVSGPKSRIDSLERLDPAVIDLTGRTTDFSIGIHVILEDDMVSVIGGSVVEVVGIIRETIIRRDFDQVTIEYTNFPVTLTLVDSPDSGSLQLSGPQLVLESLRVDDLRLEADCASILESGIFELPVQPRVPARTSIVSFQPPSANIRVVEREAGEEADQPGEEVPVEAEIGESQQ
jgi:YbbR domain-containing protein